MSGPNMSTLPLTSLTMCASFYGGVLVALYFPDFADSAIGLPTFKGFRSPTLPLTLLILK